MAGRGGYFDPGGHIDLICGQWMQVMMAACDTFRSGAVEQLKVHARCLEVDLFDRGYHRDPAAVATDAIKQATQVREKEDPFLRDGCIAIVFDSSWISTNCRASSRLVYLCQDGYDVVLIDTAGRMQNKEPLMRALAKLVSDNEPDLVLFVGEALVGNDGIDQLMMFNQALANYSPPGKLRPCLALSVLPSHSRVAHVLYV